MIFIQQIGYAALALLIAALAIYLALRLLGKLAKFVIFVVVAALVLWFFLSDHSIIKSATELFGKFDVTKGMFGF